MTETDWDCFYKCYAANYFNHGNAPYLQREFFSMIGQSMGTYLHIIFANGLGERIATSLIFRNRSLDSNERAYGEVQNMSKTFTLKRRITKILNFVLIKKFIYLKVARKANTRFIADYFPSTSTRCTTYWMSVSMKLLTNT